MDVAVLAMGQMGRAEGLGILDFTATDQPD